MPATRQKDVVLLDCTLRDGGYYTGWDFSRELVRDVLVGLDAAGVDIIELGYRSRASAGFYGLFKYCDEEMLRPLLPGAPRAKYAFMVDSKEFSKGETTADIASLRAVVPPAASSAFSWCRVATHPGGIAAATQQVESLKEWGYSVALNIMGISQLDDEALAAVIGSVDARTVDVLYLADSYGSLTPETTLKKIDGIRASYGGAIGVHMHENQGLALANTMAAIDHGVDFVDATVAGMGRGAGNLRLEQLLLAMFFRHGRKDLHPAAILPALRRHLLPLQQQHGWGWDFSYMLSGLVGIHPTYCQELKTGARYDLEEVAAILEDIPAKQRAKFNEQALLAASTQNTERKRAVAGELAVTSPYDAPPTETVLIVANGPHVHAHQHALRRFIEQSKPLVIECNDVAPLDGLERTTVVMNRVRLDELVARMSEVDTSRTVVTGLSSVPAALKGFRVAHVQHSLEAGTFLIDGRQLVLPGYVVGMMAVGLALQSKPVRIYLAGFDGFDDPRRRAEQTEMDGFWQMVRRNDHARAVEITSLLPTSYALPIRSVYSLL